jgi:GH25 family lysozyme M1 (1,4-beta-N-acetylmuramidase)
MQKFGIDISRWQGDFPVKAAVTHDGVEFAIIKCGGSDKGVYKDPKFENNYKKCKEAGIPVGVYWFSKAMSVDEAQRDAEYCYKLLAGKQFELPIYIDVENKQQLAVGKNKLTAIIDAFLSYLENKGYFVGIYSSESYFKTYMDDGYLQKYAHWIAKWTTNKPASNCGIWQFGGETNKIRSNKIQGMTVDQDYMFIDYPSIIKNAKLNGFGVDNTIRDTLAALIEKGYNLDMIQETLNTMKGV